MTNTRHNRTHTPDTGHGQREQAATIPAGNTTGHQRPYLFVIDEPLEEDRRVRDAMQHLHCPAPEVIDLRNLPAVNQRQQIAAALQWSSLMVRGMAAGVRCLPGLLRWLPNWPPIAQLFSGLPAAARLLWRTCLARQQIHQLLTHMQEEHNAPSGVQPHAELYAADLYCGVAALAASGQARIIYDSHEVQFHRKRKTGLLRILLEAGLESLVLQKANENRVVNGRIAELVADIFTPATPPQVWPNDFYPPIDLPPPPAAAPLAIVYVGKGLRGRKLELLDVHPLPCEVHLFTIGISLPDHLQARGWQLGPVDYLPALTALASSRRCFMWAASERDCLSYQLALPNKFYQALALGMPVIASAGTYLGELVEAHQLGLIINDNATLHDIANRLVSLPYHELRQHVLTYRQSVSTQHHRF